jgi:hypothetical protein
LAGSWRGRQAASEAWRSRRGGQAGTRLVARTSALPFAHRSARGRHTPVERLSLHPAWLAVGRPGGRGRRESRATPRTEWQKEGGSYLPGRNKESEIAANESFNRDNALQVEQMSDDPLNGEGNRNLISE